MQLTEHLDLGTEVVSWIVAISRAARSRRDDLEITTTHEHLCIAGVAIVLGLCGVRMVPCGNQCSVDNHDQRRSRQRDSRTTAASLGVTVATIRCAVDFEIWNTAASSRMVRFVRNTTQAISTR